MIAGVNWPASRRARCSKAEVQLRVEVYEAEERLQKYWE